MFSAFESPHGRYFRCVAQTSSKTQVSLERDPKLALFSNQLPQPPTSHHPIHVLRPQHANPVSSDISVATP